MDFEFTDDQLHLRDLVGSQTVAGQVDLGDRLGVGTERVDPDLLADQVPGAPDRTAVEDVEAHVGDVVGTVVTDDGLDRGLGGSELDDGAVEGATEVGVAGGRGLDVLGAADGVADPLQLDVAQVAEVLGELRQDHLADGTLVPQLGDLCADGSSMGARSRPAAVPADR